METETMSETSPSTVVPLPTRKPSDEPASRFTDSPTEELCDRPPYLKSLRSQLADAYSVFEDRRSSAIKAIETALTSLSNDQSLEASKRQRLMRSFEQQLARIRALEVSIPDAHRKALTVLDRLDTRAQSRRATRK